MKQPNYLQKKKQDDPTSYSECLSLSLNDEDKLLFLFLGPRGPLVLPLVGPVPSRPSALKIWITYIQAYMPYES